MQQLERPVDLPEPFELVRDVLVDFELALRARLDQLRDVDPRLVPPKGRALPDPARDQLEGPRGDLLARGRDPDHHGLAPALVAAFQRGAHDLDVAHALEGVVDAADVVRLALRHLDDGLLHCLSLGELLGVQAVRGAPLLRAGKLALVDVDRDDPRGPRETEGVDAREPDGAETENRGGVSLLDSRGVSDGAEAGRDAAAEEAEAGERRGRGAQVGGDDGDGDLVDDAVLGKG